jgi:hypothetical protein
LEQQIRFGGAAVRGEGLMTHLAVWIRNVLFLTLLSGASSSLWAQAATGELSITITDPTNASVKGAQVTITGTDTGATVRTLTSNVKGIAEVPLLQPGRYNAHIVAPGFRTVDRNGVNVSVGDVISLDIELALGESSETVTVTGDAPLIEDKSETISQVISNKQVTDLPLNGRNYLDAANYVPGVVPTAAGRDNSFTAYGNTGLQNAFLLDGSRNVNYLRGLDNQSRDMVRPRLDALREFTVDTSNISAEYGAAAGGVVTAITKSGTNHVHGSAYDFFRNDRLDAQNYFASSRPLLVRNQYGGSLGGPIKRDKAWIFAAYEGVHQRDETPSVATVPTVRASYGIFYGQDEGTGVTNRLTSNPPFFGYGSTTISSDQLHPATGFVLSSTASIARPNPIPASSSTLAPSATATLVSWPEHFKTSYVQQWSLSVQKQLPWQMLAEVNYVGNHGSQLLGLGQGNQPTVLNATTVNSRRPLAQYTIAPVKTLGNWNASLYEGISAKLEKRFLKGYSFLNSVTYGHAFDLQNPALDLCDTCGVGDTLQNNYNRAANYSSSDNDVRFRYVLTGIAESPFGRGKAFLAGSKVASMALDGWAISPVYQYQTGLPFTEAMSFDAANAGTLTRPTQLCDPDVGAPRTIH